MTTMLADPASLADGFASAGYVLDDELAMTLTVMDSLGRPLLVEGEAGVGKTEIAKALASVTDSRLIRLQCYDGLDTSAAVYEWNYTRQLLDIKLQETASTDQQLDVFGEDYLLPRPLLESIQQPTSAVLLVDEIDRADEAFEAYLLELLSDFQVSIPEFGTVRAVSRPRVLLTSNGTRELSDALRRRCLYHYLDYPDAERERQIINARVPDIDQRLVRQIVDFVQALRTMDLHKRPGVAETLDWAAALMGMGIEDLAGCPDVVLNTRGCFVKTRTDSELVNEEMVDQLLKKIA